MYEHISYVNHARVIEFLEFCGRTVTGSTVACVELAEEFYSLCAKLLVFCENSCDFRIQK